MTKTILTMLLALVTMMGQAKDQTVVEEQLFPSYWCNDKGDWTIAFLDDCAIYDCRFWTYKQRDVNAKTGEAKLVLTSDGDELSVVVGKEKKGTRNIRIGDQKALYTLITTPYMPDYPLKDTRTEFVNTGYKPDTITFVGWLKDMPDELKSEKTFEVSYPNFLTDEEETIYADLDEQGRFMVKFPVLNSTEFRCDWGRCHLHTMLEPGKTYFFFCDFKENRHYFMGDDCRLQNELLRFPPEFLSLSLYHGLPTARKGSKEQFEPYMASVDSLLTSQEANVDALCQQHPTLSTRFSIYRKGFARISLASDFGQSRLTMPDYLFTDEARQYAYQTFWKKLQEPITLYYDVRTFLKDFIQDAETVSPSNFSFNARDHIAEIAANDEELALLTRWKVWILDAEAQITATTNQDEKNKLVNELNNTDLVKQAKEILYSDKTMKMVNDKALIAHLKNRLRLLDSLQVEAYVKDLLLTQWTHKYLDGLRCSMLPEVLDTFRALVHHPLCISHVESLNDRYLAIENREFDKLVLKSADNLADITEGEELLKKLIEPYKGKFVLIDFWGTWCSGCREDLSHSTEEYLRLKDFDIQYLYLANESPRWAYENLIKQYNISGPNVAHYNLPKEQQKAIERALGITAFPSYRLVNRDGNLLNMAVDVHNLDSLVNLLEQLSEEE